MVCSAEPASAASLSTATTDFTSRASKCRAITASRRHNQRLVVRLRLQGLDQARQHHGFHQEPAVTQRHVIVGIGDRAQPLGQEALARQLANRRQQGGVVHPVGPELAVDHVAAREREIRHRLTPKCCGVYRRQRANTVKGRLGAGRPRLAAARLDPVRGHAYSTALHAGLVAEWLCSGLQIRVCRFDSGPGLQASLGVTGGSAPLPARRCSVKTSRPPQAGTAGRDEFIPE